MKTSRKLLVLVLALVMILACTVPAMALSDTSAVYTQTTIPTEDGEFYVTLSIQSDIVGSYGPITTYYEGILMGDENAVDASYTVEDVLYNAATQISWLTYTTVNGYDEHPGSFLYGVASSNILDLSTPYPYSPFAFEPVLITDGNATGYCAWAYRVNGKIVKKSNGDGALIDEAYVKAGDHIDIYFANTLTYSHATKSVKFEATGYDGTNDQLTLRGYSSYSYFGTNGNWYIGSYSVISSKTFTVKVDGVSQTVTSSSTGYFVLNNVDSGTHIIEFCPTYNSFVKNSITYQLPNYLGTMFSITTP